MSRWLSTPVNRSLLLSLLLGACPLSAGLATELASDASDDQLILEIRLQKNQAYVHEAVPMTVTLLASGVSIRNIQYPRLVAGAFQSSGFASPRQTGITRNDREYTAYEFSTTLVPNNSGKIKVGPAELSCEQLALGSGAAAFFGDSEPRSLTVRSQSEAFTVLPLPAKGRPAGFSGAVGSFKVATDITPKAVQTGDPVTLMTRIEGVGNIDSFACQALSLPGLRAYPPVARHTENSLVCEQVLIPEGATPIKIPATSISYFDPERERYQTLTSQPILLQVSALTNPASAAPATANTALARPGSDPEPGTAVYPVAVTIALASAGLSLLVLIHLARRRPKIPPQQQPAVGPSVADWLAAADKALASNDSAAFHSAVFRALQRHLAIRHGLPAAAITEEIVTRVLRPAGIDKLRLEAYADLFTICNHSRYTPPCGKARQPMQETLRRAQAALREG